MYEWAILNTKYYGYIQEINEEVKSAKKVIRKNAAKGYRIIMKELEEHQHNENCVWENSIDEEELEE
jgi:guanylate kinase